LPGKIGLTTTGQALINTAREPRMTLQVIENATCTFCGCVCDDINLHHDDLRIHKADRACVLGTAWFLNHTAEKKYPVALIDGEEATLDEAIEAAATFLHEADMPLIYGMSNTTCEAQKECAAMADLLGGLLDSHTSL
jgi:formylmethanofuran dehydrogenase subunit B